MTLKCVGRVATYDTATQSAYNIQQQTNICAKKCIFIHACSSLLRRTIAGRTFPGTDIISKGGEFNVM